jgi:hypothetical protein
MPERQSLISGVNFSIISSLLFVLTVLAQIEEKENIVSSRDDESHNRLMG